VLPARPAEPGFELVVQQADGPRRLALRADALPIAIGRSRNQTLVIDRRHAGVSGHHVDIVAVDTLGCRGVVHGDNGVDVDGRPHGPGSSFDWRPGETLRLGTSAPDEPSCTLTLSRQGDV
jgi:hypothetical protein